MVLASVRGFPRLACDVQSFPHSTHELTAAAVIVPADPGTIYASASCSLQSPCSQTFNHHWLPNARLSCLLLLVLLAIMSLPSLWSHPSECLGTNSFSKPLFCHATSTHHATLTRLSCWHLSCEVVLPTSMGQLHFISYEIWKNCAFLSYSNLHGTSAFRYIIIIVFNLFITDL